MAILPFYTAAGPSGLTVGLASAHNQNSISNDIERFPLPVYLSGSRLPSASPPGPVSNTPDEARDGRISRDTRIAVTLFWWTLPAVLGPLLALWLALGVIIPATKGEFCKSASSIAVYWVLGVLPVPMWLLIHLLIARVLEPDARRRRQNIRRHELLLVAGLLMIISIAFVVPGFGLGCTIADAPSGADEHDEGGLGLT